MRNGSTNWDALDDGFGVVADDDEGVEYVGIVEEDEDSAMGLNGAVGSPRQVRSTIASMPYRRPARPRPAPVQDDDDQEPIEVATASGVVKLNRTAVNAAAKSPLQRMGDHAVRRAAPGTYLVMSPQQFERKQRGMGDWTETFSAVIEGVQAGTEIATDIAGTVLTAQQQQAEARARAEAARIAAETAMLEEQARAAEAAAAEQRRIAEEEARRRMVRIAPGASRILQMRRALQRREPSNGAAAAANGAPGTSPVVWVLIALAGAGAIGGAVWFLTRDKGEQPEAEGV
jgi:hypothetical protein